MPAPPMPPPAAMNGLYDSWPVGAPPPLGGLPQPTPLDLMGDTNPNLGAPEVGTAPVALMLLMLRFKPRLWPDSMLYWAISVVLCSCVIQF